MSIDRANQLMARYQSGGKVDDAELNQAMEVLGLKRKNVDWMLEAARNTTRGSKSVSPIYTPMGGDQRYRR